MGSAPPSCSPRCSSSLAERFPNLVSAQIEGGIGFALTTALKSRIRWTIPVFTPSAEIPS
jgi:hypothetical protein